MPRSAENAELAPPGAEEGATRAATRLRVAYVMSRFPKLSETFVLREILALRRAGVDVDVYPLLRQRERVSHPEAAAVARTARYLPFLSPSVLVSQAVHLRRRPRAYLGALRDVVRGTWGSANFLLGGLAVFMKVAHAARLMEESGTTHVHCHFANHPALAGFVVHRLTGIPYSFTAHGSDLHKDRRMLCRKLGEAAFAVAISDYNRRVMVEECGGRHADKIIVLHCGVDTDELRPAARDRPREAPFTVACVGTLHEVKGQTHLVEACRLLAADGIEVVCRLVGDGPDRRALERQLEAAGLRGRIELEGSLTGAGVLRVLHDADVLAAPSVPSRDGRREGIPVALMEAMSVGLPVVASRLSGIPELVEDGVNGLLTPPGDARAVADALRRLHADPALRRRLGEAGRETVRREFDVSKTVAALAARFAAGGPA